MVRVRTVSRSETSSQDMAAQATERAGKCRPAGTVGDVGFNPFREHQRSALDIALVVGALVLTLGAVVWAVTGG